MTKYVDHRYRPDPDEPWRYVCPDCNSHQVRKLLRPEQRPEGKRYSFTMGGHIEAKSDRNKRFVCKSCDKRIECLLDRKDNILVQTPKV